MKIYEILVESQDLQEGPILNKIGSAVGKGIGAVAKGVGAVAGGVAGLGGAIKKGFQAGKSTVAGAGDSTGTAAPAGGTAPAAGAAPATAPAAGGATAAGKATPAGAKQAAAPQGRSTGTSTASVTSPASAAADAAAAAGGAKPGAAPAKPGAAPAAGAAPAKPGAAPAAGGAAGTAYAQAQKAIQSLQPKDKQKILSLLQKDPKVQAKVAAPAAGAAPAKPGAAPAAGAAATPAAGAAATPAAGAAATPAAGAAATPAAGTPPAAAKPPRDKSKDKYNDETGELTAYGAELDAKDKADRQAAAAGKGAFGQMAGQLSKPAADNTMANAPVSKTNTAKPGNPNAATAADAGSNPEKAALDAMKAKNPKLAGMMAQAGVDDQGNDVAAKPKRTRKKAAPSQAEIDADRDARIGPTSDSVIRRGNLIAEGHLSIFRQR